LEGLEEAALGLASGVAQGVFEWLPVSSKTILLMIFYWMGFNPAQAYAIGLFLNGSTAAAAAIYLRNDLIAAIRGVGDPGSWGWRLLIFLAASTTVTAAVAIPLAHLTVEVFSALERVSMILIAGMFCALTAILWIRERLGRNGRGPSGGALGARDAVLAGLAQGFSALPGMSRSGLTISALLALGYDPPDAVRLSFLMGVPATIGGSIYAYISSGGVIALLPGTILVTSTSAALAISILTMATMLKASQRIKPQIFTLAMAAIALAAQILHP